MICLAEVSGHEVRKPNMGMLSYLRPAASAADVSILVGDFDDSDASFIKGSRCILS